MSMTFAERTIQALRELSLSVGGVRAACRRVGVSTNTLNNWQRSGSFPANRLDPWLSAFEVDPQRFLRYAYAPFGVETPNVVRRFGNEAVTIACDSRRAAEPKVAGRLRLAYLQGTLTTGEKLDDAMLQRLDAIEALRDHNPAASASQAESLASQTSNLEVAARALGLWASALRPQRQLDQAQLLLWLALRLAGAGAVERKDRMLPVVANLQQRVSYLLAERGQLEPAFTLIISARKLFESAGDHRGAGHCHVAHALLLLDSARYDEAVTQYESALKTLPHSSRRHLGAAHQGLALALANQNKTNRAQRHALLARKYIATGTTAYAKLAGLCGRLETELGRHQAAGAYYEIAIDGLEQMPSDMLLVAAELVRCYLRQGDSIRACQTASALVHKYDAVSKVNDPMLNAVLADLIRAGMDGEAALTSTFVDRVIARLYHHQPVDSGR